MGKFNAEERALIKSTVAMLTIKRIPDNDIIKVTFEQTGKTISKQALCGVRNRIKRDSYHWYKTMREGSYEYIHEFKESINGNNIFAKVAPPDCYEKRRQPTDNKPASLNCTGYQSH